MTERREPKRRGTRMRDTTKAYLRNQWNKRGYRVKGREVDFINERVKASKRNVKVVYIEDDTAGRIGYTQATYTDNGSLSFVIELTNFEPDEAGIDTFLHELAHVEDASAYFEKKGTLEGHKEHGRTWRKKASEMGAIPSTSIVAWEGPL